MIDHRRDVRNMDDSDSETDRNECLPNQHEDAYFGMYT